MKDIIIQNKVKEKERLLEDIAVTTALAKVVQALSFIDFAEKYIWKINNVDIYAAKKLELTAMKKY